MSTSRIQDSVATKKNSAGEEQIGGIQKLRIRILGLSRDQKQFSMVVADLLGFGGCVVATCWLLFGSQAVDPGLISLVASALLVTVPSTWGLGLYRSIIRYMGLDLFVAGLKAVLVSSIIVGSIAAILELVAAPFRWTIAFGALSLIYLVGSRMIARLFLNRRNPHREQVIIYGAGEGGARLAAALFSGDDYLPVAMVDDNLHLHGKRVNGMEVFPPSRLQDIIESTEATGVLLAIPSASRHRRRQVLEQLSEYPVHVRTIPEINDLVSGKSRVDDLSEVDVKDILGRDEVPPNLDLLHASVAGKNVMVTGAGGSIGSELCRQIIRLGPSRLVCFDISEPALYQISQELQRLLAQENIG